MTAEQIREGVAAALTEVLQDEDILRDLFAAAALSGIKANESQSVRGKTNAQDAYRIADAMLEVRKRPPADSKKR